MLPGQPTRSRLSGKWCVGLLLCLSGICSAQDPVNPASAAPEFVGLTLLDSLRLAELANLDIAQAREVVRQALAARQRAQVLWLPNVTAGATYNDHEGQIQKTEGNIIHVNRNSMFVGGGPSISLGLSEILFAPNIARRILQASQAAEQRVTNDTMLAVADAYLAVQRAVRRAARVDETLLYLTADQPQPLTGDSKGLLPLIRAFVREGEALPSDLARTEVEIIRRREEAAQTVQELRVAMAELARLLRLDPRLLVWPLDSPHESTPIPGDPWLERSADELIAFALANRPEVREQQALADAARSRLRNAQFRPLLPSLVTTYTAAGFGGSPSIRGKDKKGNTLFSEDGRIDAFDGRYDWDVSLLWRLNNLGFGNLAEIREERSLVNQVEIRGQQMGDRVAMQVVQALEQVRQTSERLRILQSGLFDDQGQPGGPVYRSLRLNFIRIKRGQGRPLEVLDSIRGLSDTREAYANAMTDNERARFRLLIALGIPAQGILDPRLMPLPAGAAACEPAPVRRGAIRIKDVRALPETVAP